MNSHHHPPRWADAFLAWFCAEELLEEIQGDLYEAFFVRLEKEGPARARRQYALDVIRFCRPYAFERYSPTLQFLPMTKSYVTIAMRNLLKRKGYTFLNLAGLSIGLAALLLIGMYLKSEWTFDHSVPHHERVFRLVRDYRTQAYACMQFPAYSDSDASSQLRLPAYLTNYDGVEQACQLVLSDSEIGDGEKKYLQWQDKRLIVEHILYTNTASAFYDIFPQEFLLGNTATACQSGDRVVLGQGLARALWGEEWENDVFLGQMIELEGRPYLFAGVVSQPAGNHHVDFSLIAHQELIPSWGAYTYFRSTEGTDVSQLMTNIQAGIDKVYPGYHEDILEKGIRAIPVGRLHHTPDLLYELKPPADPVYLKSLLLVAMVILITIWTNYTNLSIAMYAGRQRELGLRKLMGARTKDISLQILVEAILLSFLSLPFVLILLSGVIPLFNEEMGLRLPLRPDRFVITLSLLVIFLTGLLSGSYPALVYSRKSLVRLFEEKLANGRQRFSLRNLLLMVQFVMLVGLLSSTCFIFQQFAFIQNKDLGFDKEGIFYLRVSGLEEYESLRSTLLQHPDVLAIGTGLIPGHEMYNQLTYKMLGSEEVLADGTLEEVDVSSLEVYGIACAPCEALKKGKSSIFVISETTARKLGELQGVAPQDLIGMTMVTEPEWENEQYGNGIPHVIDGILKDYQYFSLKYENQSLMLAVSAQPRWAGNIIVKANTDNWAEVINVAGDAFREVERQRPFDPEFLEARLEQLYVGERRAGFLMAGLSLVVVVLAMMGLMGIVSFITLSRQREMGLRKVFGASVGQLLLGLNKEFGILLVFSTLIAIPISIFAMKRWLSGFAFQISPNPVVVVFCGMGLFLLTSLVVSILARRVARQNPTDTLKMN